MRAMKVAIIGKKLYFFCHVATPISHMNHQIKHFIVYMTPIDSH